MNRNFDINWVSTGISGDVKITLWKNGIFQGIIASRVNADMGTYSWSVGNYNDGTAIFGSGYSIKIKGKGNAIADYSDSTFSIIESPTINIISPKGNESLGIGRSSDIIWDSKGISGKLKITLWRNGSLLGKIANNINASTGLFNWQVGTYEGGSASVGSGYRIKIKEKGAPIADFSENSFDIAFPSISITSPNSGENLVLGDVYNITWDYTGLTNKNIKITLWQNGVLIGVIASNISVNSGNYSWIIGQYQGGLASSGNGYKIKIKEKGTAISDYSNLPFYILDQ